MTTPVADRLSPLAREHFERPRNVGSLGGDPGSCGRGSAGAASSGDLVRMEVRLESGRVVAARFRAFGCPYAIAAASLLTEMVAGLPVADVPGLAPELVEALAVPEGREYVARLALAALADAIADAKERSAVTPAAGWSRPEPAPLRGEQG